MRQPGFFDLSERLEQLTDQGDPLERLNAVMDWKIFIPLIEKAFKRERKSAAGRKPYNRLLMFKVLVLQSLYNLSDGQTEYQIKDRLSFMRFLSLDFEDAIPDEKTIWSYREVLVESKMIHRLFQRFENYLIQKGFDAQCGSIVDATIVPAPTQRNSRDENKRIKEGEIPKSITENPHRARQKDVEARWTVKRGKAYYGYKDHINVDAKHKLIRKFVVTSSSIGDIKCLSKLIHGVPNQLRQLWADGAYDSWESEQLMKRYQLKNRITHRTRKEGWLPDPYKRENHRRTLIRSRVEHVFGAMQTSLGGKFIRTIGLARAELKIGMMNLAYNLKRYEQLCRIGPS